MPINNPPDRATLDSVAQVLREALEAGLTVEIDGLGAFTHDHKRGVSFRSKRLPKVFIAYVVEDSPAANRLYDALASNGFDPWMDRRKLLPGQNWPRAIQDAMETSDFAIACFSRNSVVKRGGFQAEIRYALDCASQVPLGEIFLIPVRLDDCEIPGQIRRIIQYIDLFPDWNAGFQRILQVLVPRVANPSLHRRDNGG